MTCYDLIDVDQRVALLRALTAGQTLVMVRSCNVALFPHMAEHPTLNVIVRTADGWTQYFEVDGTRRVYHIQDYRVAVIEKRREVQCLIDGRWIPDGGGEMSQVVVLDPSVPPAFYGYAAEHPRVGRLEEYR